MMLKLWLDIYSFNKYDIVAFFKSSFYSIERIYTPGKSWNPSFSAPCLNNHDKDLDNWTEGVIWKC